MVLDLNGLAMQDAMKRIYRKKVLYLSGMSRVIKNIKKRSLTLSFSNDHQFLNRMLKVNVLVTIRM